MPTSTRHVLEDSGLHYGPIYDDPDDMIAEIGVPLPGDGDVRLTNLSLVESKVLRDWLSARIDAAQGSVSAPATKSSRGPSPDVVRALDAMVRDPKIVSTGDLGRALDPKLNTERACQLGGNRMRQMAGRGWVVRERFARWAVTDEGIDFHRALASSQTPRGDIEQGTHPGIRMPTHRNDRLKTP